LTALLQGTRAVGISQILRRGIFRRQGGHPLRYWEVELSSLSQKSIFFCVANNFRDSLDSKDVVGV